MESTPEGLKVYRKTEDDRTYVMTVDVSRGQGLDYHAFSVVDTTESPYRVVASFRNNELQPMIYPNLVYRVAKTYNEAQVLVEINDIGGQVVDILKMDLEYDNILHTSNKPGKGQELSEGFGSGKTQAGVKTSAKVKSIGCSLLKTLIEEDKLLVEDFDTISELTTFVAKGQSYQADDGQHDDMAMTLVLFAWMTSQPYFKDLCGTNVTRDMFDRKIEQMEEDLAPFGFIQDGEEKDDGPFVDDEGDVWFNADDDDEIGIKGFF